MTSITIALPDELMSKLQDLAERHQVAPEELLRATVEDLVSSPQASFEEAMAYVLQKNNELYKRLAWIKWGF